MAIQALMSLLVSSLERKSHWFGGKTKHTSKLHFIPITFRDLDFSETKLNFLPICKNQSLLTLFLLLPCTFQTSAPSWLAIGTGKGIGNIAFVSLTNANFMFQFSHMCIYTRGHWQRMEWNIPNGLLSIDIICHFKGPQWKGCLVKWWYFGKQWWNTAFSRP